MTQAELAQRIQALSAPQRGDLYQQLLGGDVPPQHKSIVAAWEGAATVADVQSYLDQALPRYAHPAHLLPAESLPRNNNGKLDYVALAQQALPLMPASDQAQAIQSAEQWRWLAQIWCQVLGLETVAAGDNFFDLGGDSILGLGVVARARRAGYQLMVSDVFEFPTLSTMAQAAGRSTDTTAPVDAAYAGMLTPIESWFFDLALAQPHHWNMPVAFALNATVCLQRLQRALHLVYAQNPVLATRFRQNHEGWVRQPSAAVLAPLQIDHLHTQNLAVAIGDVARVFQQTLHLGDGPLFRVVVVEEDGGDRVLMLVAHHLVVDAVSWNLLMGLLEDAYVSDTQQMTPSAPRITPEIWQAQIRHANTQGQFDQQIDYWCEQLVHCQPANLVAGSRIELVHEFDAVLTQLLLHDAQSAFGTTAEELLLVALNMTQQRLAQFNADLVVHLEHHGRGVPVNGVDNSDAVGWFTSLFPFCLPTADAADLAQLIVDTKERRRAVPDNGVGYGALRYAHPDQKLRERLAAVPAILFNYLGVLSAPTADSIFRQQLAPPALMQHARGDTQALYKLELNFHVTDQQLLLSCAANTEHDGADFVREFPSQLGRLLDFCSAQQQRVYSPSDFPEAQLLPGDLDSLLDELD